MTSYTIQRRRVLAAALGVLIFPSFTFAQSGKPADVDQGSIQFIGTATVIIRYAGLTILTDPNFLHKGDHVHLGYGLKSQCLTDSARTRSFNRRALHLVEHGRTGHGDGDVRSSICNRQP